MNGIVPPAFEEPDRGFDSGQGDAEILVDPVDDF
jgi:hypothetical protein